MPLPWSVWASLSLCSCAGAASRSRFTPRRSSWVGDGVHRTLNEAAKTVLASGSGEGAPEYSKVRSHRSRTSRILAWVLLQRRTNGASNMTHAERRAFPRIDVKRRLRAEVVSLDCLEVRIVDLSQGGFLIHSPIAFEAGTEHEFRLVGQGDQRGTHIRAKCVHCSRRTTETAPTYAGGFAFVDRSARETQRRIMALVDEAIAILKFSGLDPTSPDSLDKP